MAWCCQTTNHYLNQCWPRSKPSYGVMMPQWVKWCFAGGEGNHWPIKFVVHHIEPWTDPCVLCANDRFMCAVCHCQIHVCCVSMTDSCVLCQWLIHVCCVSDSCVLCVNYWLMCAVSLTDSCVLCQWRIHVCCVSMTDSCVLCANDRFTCAVSMTYSCVLCQWLIYVQGVKQLWASYI